ncbi:putative outer membrane protein [Vibrio maritimus]|uniref:Putative outer membrane protein n=1 Tax=Vibrio maritimus TaxID=990268 RepID=A0A090TD41_9VIBR|nr:putative outer membrane protein [Vibrio maritimus]
MKKAVLASAVFAAMVSGSALAAEVYNADGTSLKIGGRAEFRGDFIGDKGKEIEGSMKNSSRFRINVGGETQITDGLTGFGFYEAEQGVTSSGDNDATTSIKQRYMYAGIGTQFGDFSFGKQDTAGVQISQMSDDGQIWTGAQKTFIAAGDEQVNNTIAYSNVFADAFSLKASVIASDEKNENGYGISGIYATPFGLDIGLGYAQNDFRVVDDSVEPEVVVDTGSENQFIGGLSYSIASLTVGGTYTQGTYKYDNFSNVDFSGVELSGTYKFDNGFRIMAAYQKQELKDTGSSEKLVLNDFAELTGQYHFNKSLRTYLSYKFDNRSKEDAGLDKVEDTVRLGVRYDF